MTRAGALPISVLFAAAVSFTGVGVRAQNTTAVCSAEFSWMSNSLGQSPCLIAAYIQGVCTDGTWTVGALPSDRHYIGPTADEANLCQCSTVAYNLVSACAACQNDIWENWSLWSFNCTSSITSIAKFPLPIPKGTAVPGYAYFDPTTEDRFNVTEARALDANPESTFTSPTATSTSTTATSTGSTPIIPVITTPASNTDSGGGSTNTKSSTPVGPIVGGVIGGLAAVGLFAGLVIWLVMRNRRQQPVQPQYSGNQPPMGPYSPQPLLGAQNGFSTQQAFSRPVLYNPDDPSTWPTNPTTPVGMQPTGETIHTSYDNRISGVPQF